MTKTTLVDSGPLIALFDKHDNYHKRVLSFLKDNRFQLVTTSAMITEVTHMLDFHVQVQIDFLEWIARKGITLHPVNQEDIFRIITLTRKYADRPMDFADATLVVTAEKTGIHQIISLDCDFTIYRLPGKVPIENLFPAGPQQKEHHS